MFVEVEAVGLERVDVVEVRELDREVLQVDAVGAVGADDVELVLVALDQDVVAGVARPLELDPALVVAPPTLGVVGPPLEVVGGSGSPTRAIRFCELGHLRWYAYVGGPSPSAASPRPPDARGDPFS